MKHKECITASRRRKLVPDDKFERHFRRARRTDNDSLKSIFDKQTEYRETSYTFPKESNSQ